VLGAIALLALAGPGASGQRYTAHLSGANASPPTTSPGVGDATFTLKGNQFTVSFTFSGLTTGTTAAHVHCCTASPSTGTADPATPVPSFPGFPMGVTSGKYSKTFDLSKASSYNPAFVTANGGVAGAKTAFINGLNSSSAYLNIHTTKFPPGEISGFIAVAKP
jgi:hypothetical protein